MAAKVDIELGRQWGVSALVVQTAAAEHLKEGLHVVWEETGNGQRRKTYTQAGLVLLWNLLGVPAEEKAPEKAPDLAPERADAEKGPVPNPAAEKPATATQRPVPTMLPIVRICPNPIWVLVQTPDKKTAHVQVRHSRLLVPGKKLACAPLPNGTWECADRLVSPNPAWR